MPFHEASKSSLNKDAALMDIFGSDCVLHSILCHKTDNSREMNQPSDAESHAWGGCWHQKFGVAHVV